MESKRLNVKLDSEKGALVAVFSSFNVTDSDNDVTEPGAFDDGKTVPFGGWNHNPHALPFGKGKIVTNDREAKLDGEIFLDTAHGKDMHGVLVGLGDTAEWSYVYDPKEWAYGEVDGKQVRILKKVDVISVDPVVRGAGVGTRTDSIKSRLTMEEQADAVLADVEALFERSKSLADLRAADGRKISQTNLDRLAKIRDGLDILLKTPDVPVQEKKIVKAEAAFALLREFELSSKALAG